MRLTSVNPRAISNGILIVRQEGAGEWLFLASVWRSSAICSSSGKTPIPSLPMPLPASMKRTSPLVTLRGPSRTVGEVPDTKKAMRTQFRSGEETVHAYTRAGIDALSLANNHMMNMGPQGMLRCIEVLDAAGIAHAGAGRTIDAAHEPAVVERKGVRVAFLAYTCVFAPPFAAAADRPGMAKVTVGTSFEPQPRHLEVPGSPPIIRTHPDPNDTAAMVKDVRRAREQADVVVTSWHWGLSGATGGASAGKVLEYQVGLGAHGHRRGGGPGGRDTTRTGWRGSRPTGGRRSSTRWGTLPSISTAAWRSRRSSRAATLAKGRRCGSPTFRCTSTKRPSPCPVRRRTVGTWSRAWRRCQKSLARDSLQGRWMLR